MKYFAIALKGWYEVRKSLKPLKRVVSTADIFRESRAPDYTMVEADGGFRVRHMRRDTMGRLVYKKGRTKVKLTVVDYEGGQKVAMLRAPEMFRIAIRTATLKPGEMVELCSPEVSRLKGNLGLK